MKTGYSVEGIMTRDVLTMLPDIKIVDCAKIMAEKEVGSTVIVRDGKLLGILTEQDLARKVLAKNLNPETTYVEAVMSRNVVTINPEADVYDAMLKMDKSRIKHLPVLKNGRLQGIVSFKDIVKIQPDLIDIISFKSTKEEAGFSEIS